MVYLFIGQDSPSKDIQLKNLKQQFLAKGTEEFNLDILYAREIALKTLQERLLCLPVNNPQRIIVIKDAQNLKEESREFILKYARRPYKQVVLILDIEEQGKLEGFIKDIYRHAKVYRFRETREPDTFLLGRQIDARKADYALRVLNQLLRNGERPERILGGLRYLWERESAPPPKMKKKLKLLLNCDIDIKTGRLKPAAALEKLVINLCGLAQPFR